MDNFRSNRCPPIVASTATPSPSSNAAQAARRQSRAPEFVPAPPIVNLNSMINDARQLEDVRLQLAAQAEQIKLLQRQIFIERSTSSKRSFGRDPVLSRRIQKEYQAFKDQNGVAFDFSVPPSEGDNRIVIDGMLPSLLDFNANRRRISDPQQRLSFVAEITHRIKKHRESLKAAQKIAETRTAEELLEDARLSMLKGRKKRKIQRRQEAFDAMGSTLPLPRQCPSHDMLKKYIFDFEIISDDEDDTMDMIGSKATRWISVQPSWRSEEVNRVYQLLDDYKERGSTAIHRNRIIRNIPRRNTTIVYPEWIYRQDPQ